MIRRRPFFKNCKPALTNAEKRVKTIDATDTVHQVRQYAKKAIDGGKAELAGAFAPRAYAMLQLAA